MHEYGYVVTEHDADRPWIILSREHRTIDLEDGVLFFEWAAREHPAPRFTVRLDPWQLRSSLASD